MMFGLPVCTSYSARDIVYFKLCRAGDLCAVDYIPSNVSHAQAGLIHAALSAQTRLVCQLIRCGVPLPETPHGYMQWGVIALLAGDVDLMKELSGKCNVFDVITDFLQQHPEHFTCRMLDRLCQCGLCYAQCPYALENTLYYGPSRKVAIHLVYHGATLTQADFPMYAMRLSRCVTVRDFYSVVYGRRSACGIPFSSGPGRARNALFVMCLLWMRHRRHANGVLCHVDIWWFNDLLVLAYTPWHDWVRS